MNGGKNCKAQKISMIPFTNTVTNPRAMVIMNLYTSLAFGTVERSWRSVNITSSAFVTKNFLTFY